MLELFVPFSEFKEQIKLLFLTASPMSQGQINTGNESRFKDLIKEFDENKLIRFREEHGLTSEKFQNILFTDDPHIVHYGGHGSREGIFLEDKRIRWRFISRIIGRCRKYTMCSPQCLQHNGNCKKSSGVCSLCYSHL